MKIVLFILLVFFSSAQANDIKTLVQINNYSITNIDLIKEININEILKQRNLNNTEKKILLNNLIEQKVKDMETKKRNIKINQSVINQNVMQILKNYNIDQENKESVREYIFKKVDTKMKWNKLIMFLFSKKLEINMDEIEENMKIKNIDIKKKEAMIQAEKTKKINIISNTFYNEIKRKYLIKSIE